MVAAEQERRFNHHHIPQHDADTEKTKKHLCIYHVKRNQGRYFYVECFGQILI